MNLRQATLANRAISDPLRSKIIHRLLATGQAQKIQLCAEVDRPLSVINQELSILEQLSIVEVWSDGTVLINEAVFKSISSQIKTTFN